MSEKKFQVFISSTFDDLKEERQLIIRGILDLDHIPSGMELFPATGMEQFEYIKQFIDECDYYVLLIGARYGTLNQEGVSYTEKEYDYAVVKQKHVIVLLHGALDEIPVGKTERDPESAAKLKAFVDRVSINRLFSTWTNRENLTSAFMKSFAYATRRYPVVGWVRADTIANRDTLIQMNELRKDNARLKDELQVMFMKEKPEIADAADLDDKYKLRYTSNSEGLNSGGKLYGFVTVLWRDLFVAIAPRLYRPVRLNDVEAYLHQYIRERFAVPKDFALARRALDNVKIYLYAVGLIDIQLSGPTEEEMEERLVLTERGKRVMIESMTSRKLEIQPNREASTTS